MRKFIIFFLFTYISSFCIAQTYKYLGVEDGLSNRRIYAIQKGPKGYMWFLTHNGIDRYDGKNFKQYRLIDSEIEVNSMLNLSWLYVGVDGTLWEIGKKGRVFRYDAKHDRFQLVYKLPDEVVKGNPTPVSYGFIDSNNIVWLCNEEALYLYDTNTEKTTIIKNHIGESITDIEQIDPDHYFIGTDVGIHHAELKDNVLNLSPCNWLDKLKMQVNELYFHKANRKLFIGTFQKGIYLYDMNIHQTVELNVGLQDVSITRIKAFNDKEILIATDGAGIYKMNVDTYECAPYIVADYNSYNAMNGNSIYDFYVDDERIWIANYPIGITVRNNQYASYEWIKHSIGNKQSLVNDQVNAIIEDHEGDLWFATNNGISLYSTKTKQWHSFLSVFDNGNVTKNHVFISLCEVSPGIIWAGGYTSGIYQINKKQMKVEFFTPSTFGDCDIRPDKYIRSIIKTSDGSIWSGGYYNLKQIDFNRKNIRAYPGLSGITDIKEKDAQHMWIGTATGLYLLDKETGKYQCISMPIESFYINALYQTPDSLLYIGTSNSGLLIYNHQRKSFEHFHKDNCPLISNNIYTILPDGNKSVLLSTENSLTSYYPAGKIFHNWTKEQGLKSDHFNSTSGVLRKNGNFILGSTDGAIEFHKDMMIPRNYEFKMILSDLRVFYQTVYPGDEGSPLEVDIDETQVLKLKYNQNIFSLRISSINYDYPSLILYSWKLEGFYDGWSRPEKDCMIRFTNLNPGKYTLRVRAISSEDRRIVLEERDMEIMIEQPLWLSIWALILYAAVIAAIVIITLRVIILRKQRKASDEKIRFFINTAHDIRTPLTLIKAPLEELSEKENLTPSGRSNMNTAIRNVNALLRLTTNLINFERADTYSSALYVSEYELSTYMEEMINAFRAYADVKRISLTYESNFRYMNTWLDKDKMDSILKNLISNALKYTEKGVIHILVKTARKKWTIEVKDTGIGIPKEEQGNIFHEYYRAQNAMNFEETGSGIGLMITRRIVKQHHGTISFSSVEGQGTTFTVTFPQRIKASVAVEAKADGQEEAQAATGAVHEETERARKNVLLLAEDDADMREYLVDSLSSEYKVVAVPDGGKALETAREINPDIIISDIVMPVLEGDELCRILKSSVETSHIPIILLTALSERENIIFGLEAGANDYIIKPFDLSVLKVRIRNILQNRQHLRETVLAMDAQPEETDYTSQLDKEFLDKVMKVIEEELSDSEFSINDFCRMLGMSRTSVYNKIKTLTGQGPNDFIRIVRLNKAKELLVSRKYSIGEVANMVGFSDPKYFSTCFKKQFGTSPSKI